MKIETITYDANTILEIGQLLNGLTIRGMDNVSILTRVFDLIYNGAVEKGEREMESVNDK